MEVCISVCRCVQSCRSQTSTRYNHGMHRICCVADLALQSTWRLPNRKAEAADLICTILRQDLACKREMMEASFFL